MGFLLMIGYCWYIGCGDNDDSDDSDDDNEYCFVVEIMATTTTA